MTRLLIVVEKESDWGSYYPSDNVITAGHYLRDATTYDERTQVINLCRSYRYLVSGYYVSLLAEARGHRVTPSVRTINDLRGRALYALDIQDLNQKLSRFPRSGGFECVDLAETPPQIVKLALRATRLIGNGLYGVDLKQSGKRCVVIEVNDNPSIDSGVEDGKLGKQLYRDIMAEFLRRMEQRRLGAA